MKIAYLTNCFGTQSHTFMRREIRALRELGVDLALYGIRKDEDGQAADAKDLVDETHYLYPVKKAATVLANIHYFLRNPVGYLRGLWQAFTNPEFSLPRRAKMVTHYCLAAPMARHMEGAGITHIHAQFLNVSSSVAMYAAEHAGIPFSVTVHSAGSYKAADTVGLHQKLRAAEFLIMISHYNVSYYDAVSRLRDSQLGDERVKDIRNYIRRGKLWEAFALDEPATPIEVVAMPEPLPLPGQLKEIDAKPAKPEPANPATRVAQANKEARMAPTRDGFINAIQVWPYTEGALYQVYASPGRVTLIQLQLGERLIDVSAGDTVRWIVGDSTSGSGTTQRPNLQVKPVRAGLKTNLVVTTDRRIYLLELTSTESAWMASVSWDYPQDRLDALNAQAQAARQVTPLAAGLSIDQLRFRYDITGDKPAWRPLRAFDDGQKVYIQFPAGIAQGDKRQFGLGGQFIHHWTAFCP